MQVRRIANIKIWTRSYNGRGNNEETGFEMRLSLGVAAASFVALAFAVPAARPAAADSAFNPPTVDYSADVVRESAGATQRMKIFRTKDRSRTEMLTGGRPMVAILDLTKKEVTNLDPEKKTYSRTDLGKLGVGGDPFASGDYKRTLQGKETIGGVETSKYLYEGTTGPANVKGTVWMTNDNIPLRNEAKIVVAGQTISSITHLENLKIGKLDPGLFEVPTDYTARQGPGPIGKP